MQKECYFTSANIAATAASFLAQVQSPNRLARIPFVLERSALLILDMQRYFLTSKSHAFVPAAEAIIPVIQRLTRMFLRAGRPVIMTRHINTESDAGMMAQWWRELLTEDNPAAALDARVTAPGVEILDKPQYDAFYATDLAERLRAAHIATVVISGVLTHLCCETTARSAFVHGFGVYLPVDATATYNSVFHCASLRNLAHACVVPVLSSAWCNPNDD